MGGREDLVGRSRRDGVTRRSGGLYRDGYIRVAEGGNWIMRFYSWQGERSF